MFKNDARRLKRQLAILMAMVIIMGTLPMEIFATSDLADDLPNKIIEEVVKNPGPDAQSEEDSDDQQVVETDPDAQSEEGSDDQQVVETDPDAQSEEDSDDQQVVETDPDAQSEEDSDGQQVGEPAPNSQAGEDTDIFSLAVIFNAGVKDEETQAPYDVSFNGAKVELKQVADGKVQSFEPEISAESAEDMDMVTLRADSLPGADKYRIYISGLKLPRDTWFDGFKADGNALYKGYTPEQLAALAKSGVLELVVEANIADGEPDPEEPEIPQAPAEFTVFVADAEDNAPVAGINVALTGNQGNKFDLSGVTGADGTVNLDIPGDGESFLLSVSDIEGAYAENTLTLTREELEEGLIAVLVEKAPANAAETLSITVNVTEESKIMSVLWGIIGGTQNPDDLAGMKVELRDAAGQPLLPEVSGITGSNGKVTLTGIPVTGEAATAYRIYISGYAANRVVKESDGTRWKVSGPYSYKEFTEADFTGGNFELTVLLDTLADSEMFTYAVNTQLDNRLTSGFKVTMVPLDENDDPMYDDAETLISGDSPFTAGNLQWKVPRADYLLIVESISSHYLLANSSKTFNNFLSFVKGDKDIGTGIWTYTFKASISQVPSAVPGTTQTLTFQDDEAKLTVTKDFDASVPEQNRGANIWVGILLNTDPLDRNSVEWKLLPVGEVRSATFDVRRYFTQAGDDGVMPVSLKAGEYYILEYAPNTMKPSTSGWTETLANDFNYPDDQKLSGYTMYRSGLISIRPDSSGMDRYTVKNADNPIEFRLDGSEDLKADMNISVFKGWKYNWKAEKKAVKNAIDLTGAPGSDGNKGSSYTVDYTVTFTRSGQSNIEETTIAFSDIYLNLVYTKTAAIGQNFVRGKFELFRNGELTASYIVDKSLLTSYTEIYRDDPDFYLKKLDCDTLTSPYTPGDLFEVRFTGYYYYNSEGNPSDEAKPTDDPNTMAAEIVKSATIRMDAAPPISDDDSIKDENLHRFLDNITVPDMAFADDTSVTEVLVNGSSASFTVSAMNGNIEISIPGTLYYDYLNNKIEVTYKVTYQDKSWSVPCSTGYDIVNKARAQGEVTNSYSSPNPVTATVHVTTAPEAYVRVDKFRIENGTEVREQEFKFKLFKADGVTLLGTAKTNGSSPVIFMKGEDFTSVNGSPSESNYADVAWIGNPNPSTKVVLKVFIEDASYPPFKDALGDIKWSPGGDGWWSAEYNLAPNSGLTGEYARFNGEYCGPTDIKVYNLPDTGVTVTKTGAGLDIGVSRFFVVNKSTNAAKELPSALVGSVRTYSLKGLPYGTYTLYEVTDATLKPEDDNGFVWTEVNAPSSLNLSISDLNGKKVFQLAPDFALGYAYNQSKTFAISVNNQIRGNLTITKAVKGGGSVNPNDVFTFYILPKSAVPGIYDRAKITDGVISDYALRFTVSGKIYAYASSGGNQALTVTGTGILTVNGLPAGEYVIIEKTPNTVNGVQIYDWDTGIKDAVIGYSNNAYNEDVIFYNKLVDPGEITVAKAVALPAGITDATEFSFTVKDEKGTAVALTAANITFDPTSSGGILGNGSEGRFWLKGGGKATISNLPQGGKYTIAEDVYNNYTTAVTPQGNPTINNTAELIVGSANTAATFTNTLKTDGKITLTKSVSTNGFWPTGGFKFQLYRYNGTTWEVIPGNEKIATSQIPAVEWTGLAWGQTYRIYEENNGVYIPTGVGWQKDADNGKYYRDITINSSTVIAVLLRNDITKLTVTKNVVNGNPSHIFTFQVLDADNNPVSFKKDNGNWIYTTDPDGAQNLFTLTDGDSLYLYGLLAGVEYTVVETVNGGYITSYSVTDGKVTFAGSELSKVVTITNTSDASLTVTKKVANSNEAGKDFEMQLFEVGPIDILLRVKATENADEYTILGTDINSPTSFTVKSGDPAGTEGDPVTIIGLTPGKTYRVQETTNSAAGYTVSYSSENVEIISGNTSGRIVVTNEAASPTLTVTKNASNAGSDIFTITVSGVFTDGDIPRTFIFGDGHTPFGTGRNVPGVIAGNEYTITEDSLSLANYNAVWSVSNATKIDDVVNGIKITAAAGASSSVEVTNTRKEASLTVTKTVTGGEWRDGDTFTFELTQNGAPVVGAAGITNIGKTVATDSNGRFDLTKDDYTVTFSGLTVAATYTVKEITTGMVNYTLVGNEEKNVAISETGSSVGFENARKQTGSLEVAKTVSGVWGESDEFTFTLSKGGSLVIGAAGTTNTGAPITTDSGGQFKLTKTDHTVTFTGLPAGDAYTVQEVLSGTQYTFVSVTNETAANSDTASLTASVETALPDSAKALFTNSRNPGSIELTKTVADTAIQNRFTFALYEDVGGPWKKIANSDKTVTAPGILVATWDGIEVGKTYRIYEMNAGVYVPDGWTKDNTGYYKEVTLIQSEKFEIALSNDITKLTVKKTVINGDNADAFRFAVKNSSDAVMSFTQDPNHNWYYDASGTPGTILDISNGESVDLYGLPFDDYTVEEVDLAGAPHSYGYDVSYSYSGANDYVTLALTSLTGTAVITNEVKGARLSITKEIANLKQGETVASVFQVAVRDNDTKNYLTFDVTGVWQDSSSPTPVPLNIINGQTLTLTGLPYKSAGYTVEEIGLPPGYDLSKVEITQPAFTLDKDPDSDMYMWAAASTVKNYLTTDDGAARLRVKKTTEGLVDGGDKFTLDVTGLFYIPAEDHFATDTRSYVFTKTPGLGEYEINDTAEVDDVVLGMTYTVVEQDSINATQVVADKYDTEVIMDTVTLADTAIPAQTLEIKNTRKVADVDITKTVIGNQYQGISNGNGVFDIKIFSGTKELRFEATGTPYEYTYIPPGDTTATAVTVQIKSGETTRLTGVPVGLTLTFAETVNLDHYTVEIVTSDEDETLNVRQLADNQWVEVTNTVVTALTIEKYMASGNDASRNGTYYFNIRDAAGDLVPVRSENGNYYYDPSSANTDILVKTTAGGGTGYAGYGSVKVYGLPVGDYTAREQTNRLGERYYLKSSTATSFTFRLIEQEDAPSITSHTATFTNARRADTPTGGGDSSGGGSEGRRDRDRDRSGSNTNYTTIADESVPLATIGDPPIPLANTGGIPIEAIGLIGAAVIGMGVLMRIRKKEEEDTEV